jgi:hypothetical protein
MANLPHMISLVLEPDQYSYDSEGRYAWTIEKRDQAWEDCFARLSAALSSPSFHRAVLMIGIPGSGKSTMARKRAEPGLVVFDGVFAQRATRLRAVEIARKAGKPISAIWLQTPWDECIRRNALRSPDRRIPEESMRGMEIQLEREPPTLEEGYATLEIVESLATPDDGARQDEIRRLARC